MNFLLCKLGFHSWHYYWQRNYGTPTESCAKKCLICEKFQLKGK